MATGLAAQAKKMDHPIVFLVVMTIGVFATASVLSWGAKSMGWSGIVGFFKGGVA